MIIGTITGDMSLLGTSMRLRRGQRVDLTLQTNLPLDSRVHWYARPIGAEAGPEWGSDYSFPIGAADVTVGPPKTLRRLLRF